MQVEKLDHVDPSMDASDFFHRYISQRMPVVIRGLLDDPSFHARKWTDLAYLSKKAGASKVLIEPLHPTSQQFGTGIPRTSTLFSEFLTTLQSDKDPAAYLTTQYADDEDDEDILNNVTVFPPPTDMLKDDFPDVPRIMGNLFLQQVNLWLGKSKNGSSSGLHHDFHDNLYCLLQGRKRFVLFPPVARMQLYPHGTLHKHYDNGLISYTDAPVHADGLSNRIACTALVRALEVRISELPPAKGKQRAGTSTKQDRLRKRLLKAYDAAVDELEKEILDAGDEPGAGNQVDDFDQLMSTMEDHDDFGNAGAPETGDSDTDSDNDMDVSSIGEPELKEPSSFSRISAAQLHKYLRLPTTAQVPVDAEEFPQLSEAPRPYIVELRAGDMLYLPASWWHEVTSSSDSDAGDAVHMAFNYWFYPPDALDNFENPYKGTMMWGYLRGNSRRKTGRDSDSEDE